MSVLARRGWLCVPLIGVLLIGCQQPKAPLVDIFDTENVKEISGFRILHVKKEIQPAAIEMLGNQDAVALTSEQLAALLPQRKIEPDTMLQMEIDNNVAQIRKREAELAMPFFANDAVLKEEVGMLKSSNAYLSGLKGKLKPYLLMAKLCSKDENYGFTGAVDLRNGYFVIDQGCLSRAEIVPWSEPVVVYSEVPVTKVDASIVVDE